MEDQNNIQAALDAGAALTSIRQVMNGTPFIAMPEGYTIKSLEDLLPKPARIQAKPELHTLDSFLDYVNQFKGSSTRIFGSVDETGAVFDAIFDYHHEHTVAEWCQHRANYKAPHSKEWMIWKGIDGKATRQQEFAEFIEANLIDIHKPDGATMLEMALTFNAKTAVEFNTGIRLQNGKSQLLYSETTEAKAGQKGEIIIPEDVELFISVFKGSGETFVPAKLRYRITEGILTLTIKLQRPHIVVRDAAEKILTTVEEKTGITVWHGKA